MIERINELRVMQHNWVCPQQVYYRSTSGNKACKKKRRIWPLAPKTRSTTLLTRSQRRLLATGGAHAHGRLEAVVDPPLEALRDDVRFRRRRETGTAHTSKGTNHDNTGTETLGGERDNADFGGDLTDALASVRGFAHKGDDRVGWVRDDSADDTGKVTGGEGDTELRGLAVGIFRRGEHAAVEHLHNVLEEEELRHRVGDLYQRPNRNLVSEKRTVEANMTHLTRPQGNEGAEGETRLDCSPAHFCDGGAHRDGEGASRAGLNLDLGHLQRAESNVGEELGRRRASEPDGTLVFCRGLLTGQVHVGILEELVETVLEHSLEGVAHEGRADTFPETPAALLCGDHLEARDEAFIFARIDLRESG